MLMIKVKASFNEYGAVRIWTNDSAFLKSEQFEKFKNNIEYRKYIITNLKKEFKELKFSSFYKWSTDSEENLDKLCVIFPKKKFYIEINTTEMTLMNIKIKIEKMRRLVKSHFNNMFNDLYIEVRKDWIKWGYLNDK